MQLIVDDEPCGLAVEPGLTIGEIARRVCPNEGADARMVVSIRCDGEDVPPDELEAVLQRPADGFSEIAFATLPMQSLIVQSLVDALEILEAADSARSQAAHLLAQGEQQAAIAQLQQFLEHWRGVQNAFTLCTQALGCSVDELEANGIRADDFIERIKAHLLDLRAALQASDLVLVSDILQYELEAPFQQWRTLLLHLRDTAVAQP